MDQSRILWRRRFDWFNLLYPIVPVGLVYWVVSYHGGSPFREPGFMVLVAAVVLGQAVYFVVAARSASGLDLDGDDLVVRWRNSGRQIRVPVHLVRCDRSSMFSNGHVLWCDGTKVRIFADSETIKQLAKFQDESVVCGQERGIVE